MVQLPHPYMTTWKIIVLTRQTFVGKVLSLLFSMLSRFVIAFLPRSKCLLIWWLQSTSKVVLETKKIKCHSFHCFPNYLPWRDGTRCHDLRFLMLSFKSAFSLSSFTFIKRLFSPLLFCHNGGVICISEVVDISPGNLDSSLCFIQSGISHDVCRLSLVLSPESHSLEGSGIVFQRRICRTFWRWYSGRSHYSLMVTKIRHCDRHTGRGKPTHSSILCSDLPKCSCFLANRRSRPSKRSMASDPQRT